MSPIQKFFDALNVLLDTDDSLCLALLSLPLEKGTGRCQGDDWMWRNTDPKSMEEEAAWKCPLQGRSWSGRYLPTPICESNGTACFLL